MKPRVKGVRSEELREQRRERDRLRKLAREQGIVLPRTRPARKGQKDNYGDTPVDNLMNELFSGSDYSSNVPETRDVTVQYLNGFNQSFQASIPLNSLDTSMTDQSAVLDLVNGCIFCTSFFTTIELLKEHFVAEHNIRENSYFLLNLLTPRV